jgi:hypothetical protein
MSEILLLVIKYQLGHPLATKEDCKEYLSGTEASEIVGGLLEKFPAKGKKVKKDKDKVVGKS